MMTRRMKQLTKNSLQAICRSQLNNHSIEQLTRNSLQLAINNLAIKPTNHKQIHQMI